MDYHLRYYDSDGNQVGETVDLPNRDAATTRYDTVCADFDGDVGPDRAVLVELDENGSVTWKHKRTVAEPAVVVIPFAEPATEPVTSTPDRPKSTIAKKKH